MGSRVFNGTTDKITVTHGAALNMSPVTWAFWIKKTGAGTGDFRILNKATASNTGPDQITGQSGFASGLRGRMGTSGTAAVAISHNAADALTDNQWVCLFITYEQAATQTIKIYKYNGTNAVAEITYSSVTNSASAPVFNTTDMTFGNNPEATLGFQGKLAYFVKDATLWDNAKMLSFAQGEMPMASLIYPFQGTSPEPNLGAISGFTGALTGTTYDAADSPPVDYGIEFVDHLTEGVNTDPSTLNYNLAATGNLLVTFIGFKPIQRTVNAIAEFTDRGRSESAAGVSAGGDVGDTVLNTWTRVVTGTEPATSSIDWSISNASPGIQSMLEFKKASGSGAWELAWAGGADSTTATGVDGYSATASSDPGFTAGDVILAAVMLPTDSGVTDQDFVNPEIVVPGCTLRAFGQPVNFGTSVGNDGRLLVWMATVDSGTSSGAPSIAYDTVTAAASYGAASFLRLRAGAGGGDTTPPSVPTGLAASNITSTSVDLDWNVSTDDTAVTGYKVYQDGVEVDDVPTNSVTITGLTPETTYDFTVSAYDAATNESAQSTAEEVVTLAESEVLGDRLVLMPDDQYRNVIVETYNGAAWI